MANDCTPQPMTLGGVMKQTCREWSEDKASRLAAAFAYYAIFSIGPLVLIAITLLGMIYGSRAAGDQIRPELEAFVGEKAAGFIQDMVAKAGYSPSLSFAGILSVVLILYAATNLFVSLQDALNTIFGVEARPGRGVMGVIKDRLLSFVMVMLVGVFVLASVVASAALSGVTSYLSTGNPTVTAILAQGLNFVVSVLLFTGVFSLLFKYLPDVTIDWKDTLIGSLVTSILFTAVRGVLGYYLAHSSTAGPFGAAGSLVIVMLFIYYSAQIFFFGAEFTQVWACRSGKPLTPSANAKTLEGEIVKMGDLRGKLVGAEETAAPPSV